MNKIVGFGLGCVGTLLAVLGVVMYFGVSGAHRDDAGPPKLSNVERWLERSLPGVGGELVRLGTPCQFSGGKGLYRLAQVRVHGAPASAPLVEYVLLFSKEESVLQHWTLRSFREERRNEASVEQSPERVAWKLNQWDTMLKEMGVPGGMEIPAKPTK